MKRIYLFLILICLFMVSCDSSDIKLNETNEENINNLIEVNSKSVVKETIIIKENIRFNNIPILNQRLFSFSIPTESLIKFKGKPNEIIIENNAEYYKYINYDNSISLYKVIEGFIIDHWTLLRLYEEKEFSSININSNFIDVKNIDEISYLYKLSEEKAISEHMLTGEKSLIIEYKFDKINWIVTKKYIIENKNEIVELLAKLIDKEIIDTLSEYNILLKNKKIVNHIYINVEDGFKSIRTKVYKKDIILKELFDIWLMRWKERTLFYENTIYESIKIENIIFENKKVIVDFSKELRYLNEPGAPTYAFTDDLKMFAEEVTNAENLDISIEGINEEIMGQEGYGTTDLKLNTKIKSNTILLYYSEENLIIKAFDSEEKYNIEKALEVWFKKYKLSIPYRDILDVNIVKKVELSEKNTVITVYFEKNILNKVGLKDSIHTFYSCLLNLLKQYPEVEMLKVDYF